MPEENRIETVTRGVCVSDGRILLCYGKGDSLTYLPGGHVEFRETARRALEREIREELGLTACAGIFLGCCEHAFFQEGEAHTEINLVFLMEIPELSVKDDPESREFWIGFRWFPLDCLEEANLEPAPLRKCLAVWLKHPGGHFVSGDAWL